MNKITIIYILNNVVEEMSISELQQKNDPCKYLISKYCK